MLLYMAHPTHGRFLRLCSVIAAGRQIPGKRSRPTHLSCGGNQGPLRDILRNETPLTSELRCIGYLLWTRGDNAGWVLESLEVLEVWRSCLSSPQSHARAPLAGSGADADADACRYLSTIYPNLAIVVYAVPQHARAPCSTLESSRRS